jgi:hypothetical protein
MKSLFNRLAIMSLFVLAANSFAPSAARESITVSRRPWFLVCEGVCPDYEVTVWADGRVLVKRDNHEDRFRVSRAEVADFRRKLRPFRPVGEQLDPLICSHAARPEDEPPVMEVVEIEIRWSGTDHPARLTACDNRLYADLTEAIRQALWSIHLYLDGRRRD